MSTGGFSLPFASWPPTPGLQPRGPAPLNAAMEMAAAELHPQEDGVEVF